MALTPEWTARVNRWREELKRHFYSPLGIVPVQASFTKEHLGLEQALKRSFTSIAPGAAWGRTWEYGWFKGRLTVPRGAAGKRIVTKFDVGGEALIFVNGQEAGFFAWARHYCTLTKRARSGESFEIAAEAYAGHGPVSCGDGPVPLDRPAVPQPTEPSTAVREVSFGVFEEDAYQLWLDVETLWQIRECIDANSLRVAEIDAGLRDVTLIADFEVPSDLMTASFISARRRLKPLLACVNGSTAPVMFAFGHAHLDVAWLWPFAETKRKAARTLSAQLALIDEYPGYKFLHSQCQLYVFVKEHYPRLYARVKKAARTGAIIAEGGMWIEADTNISGGEALIRQFVHGKRFLRQEFGVDSKLLWLPDVFGYCANLPQIMKGCGIDYFSTSKIFWNYYGGENFPHNTFRWQGIDGSKTLVHLHNDYNSEISPARVIARWNERVQKDGVSTRLMPFGWGDGGGGPTRDHLEFARREENLEGVPRVRLASPIDYFEDLLTRGVPDVTYVGELYFQAHRGTYTSQARVKKGNRRAELALRDAELWGVAARALGGPRLRAADLDASWKELLLCQFHDVLPGSSIGRVYEEAEAMHARIIDTARRRTETALASLVKKRAAALTVFNSLSWPRVSLVELPDNFAGARDGGGRALPVQKLDGKFFAEVRVPACGWTTVEKSGPAPVDNELRVTPGSLENRLLKVTLNAKGEIAGIYDKEARREIAAGPCNSLHLYKDVPSNWDAWDLDSQYRLCPVELPRAAKIEVTARGPLVGVLRISRTINQSSMVQQIRLARDSRRIDFATVIDWRERHKVLKVNFPVTVHADEALHEIQMGHVRRPTHASRQYDADRFEVCNHKWTALCEENRGCAVLNDCKYGVNVDRNSINLTLLRSPLSPDMNADRGRHEFTYALYAWNGPFVNSGCIAQAYDLNVPVTTARGFAGERSLFQLDAENVVIEAVKPAEDESGDVIVRLYESVRSATRCTLSVSLPVTKAEETDMLETPMRDVKIRGGGMLLDFRPFEIKTVRMRLGRAKE